jgi:pimeloyl-ACP methyl ester carboxylesterase
MIDDAGGSIDYDACGSGPTLVLVPGSFSTGAAWRPVIAALNGQFRCVTTSLLGYGGTAERRTARDASIRHEADVIEAVIRIAGGAVHLVGHSFGGLVALAVARRNHVIVKSLVLLEAPATELLRHLNEDQPFAAFNEMTSAYFAAFAAGQKDAIGSMIDFYGGPGTFESWPARLRAYAIEMTPVNIMDWASSSDFPIASEWLARIAIPTLVMWGGMSHPAVQRANALLSRCLATASAATVGGAAHFLITSHASEVAKLIANHVVEVEASTARQAV